MDVAAQDRRLSRRRSAVSPRVWRDQRRGDLGGRKVTSWSSFSGNNTRSFSERFRYKPSMPRPTAKANAEVGVIVLRDWRFSATLLGRGDSILIDVGCKTLYMSVVLQKLEVKKLLL